MSAPTRDTVNPPVIDAFDISSAVANVATASIRSMDRFNIDLGSLGPKGEGTTSFVEIPYLHRRATNHFLFNRKSFGHFLPLIEALRQGSAEVIALSSYFNTALNSFDDFHIRYFSEFVQKIKQRPEIVQGEQYFVFLDCYAEVALNLLGRIAYLYTQDTPTHPKDRAFWTEQLTKNDLFASAFTAQVHTEDKGLRLVRS